MVKKIVARTQNDGWKPKKKRKPMTEEQRIQQKDLQSQGQENSSENTYTSKGFCITR